MMISAAPVGEAADDSTSTRNSSSNEVVEEQNKDRCDRKDESSRNARHGTTAKIIGPFIDARPILPKAAFFLGDLRDGLSMVSSKRNTCDDIHCSVDKTCLSCRFLSRPPF